MSVSEVAVPRQLTKAGYRLRKALAPPLWSRHYGEGYVATVDRDVAVFGTTAAMPTPPVAQDKAER
ncbi:hypothetical protein [Ancylobacter oerskovii]|uniref:Uncharacterized protein n=1 Tax=Ancylobacter oerskovii TaxID=459519 RepID=A0ABW4Z2N0_9HYPH|nr:hypothetical protein [Ancylobacter oerskovii]MBS7546272.1 hypothetical protein [Ancylobacter oerskovii]